MYIPNKSIKYNMLTLALHIMKNNCSHIFELILYYFNCIKRYINQICYSYIYIGC